MSPKFHVIGKCICIASVFFTYLLPKLCNGYCLQAWLVECIHCNNADLHKDVESRGRSLTYQSKLAPVNIIWQELLVCLRTWSSTTLVITFQHFIGWITTNSYVHTANKTEYHSNDDALKLLFILHGVHHDDN